MSDRESLTAARRFDLRGYRLNEVIHITKCEDCGMGLVSGREFHPYRACEVFKETHDSDRVWEALMPLVEQMQRDR